MKNAHGCTCKGTKVYIYLYISLYENLFENGCIYIYIYISCYRFNTTEKKTSKKTHSTLTLAEDLSLSYFLKKIYYLQLVKLGEGEGTAETF